MTETDSPHRRQPLMDSLFATFDYVLDRLFTRIEGLGRDEYLWEPTENAWSVRELHGGWLVDWADPDPEPAPVTTIAWRLWHLADCLASYVVEFGGWPLQVRSLRDGAPTWFDDVEPAVLELRTARAAFTERIRALGEEGLHRPLGARWGPFADDTWADLVLHAIDEMAHHGAEIALLRDLYPALSPALGPRP